MQSESYGQKMFDSTCRLAIFNLRFTAEPKEILRTFHEQKNSFGHIYVISAILGALLTVPNTK